MYCVKEYSENETFIEATFFQISERKEAVEFSRSLEKDYPKARIVVVEIDYNSKGELQEVIIK
jgi:hypothetical protein